VGSETINGIQPVATTEFSNNVISNWAQTKAGYGSDGQLSNNNFIGNYYINNKNPHPTTNLFRGDVGTSMYATGNFYGEASTDGTITGAHVITNNGSYFGGGTTFVNQPFDISGTSPDTRETADVALERVQDYSGSNWQNRSPIDQYIIGNIGNSAANQINDLTGSPQASQWTTLMAQRPDANGNAPFTRAANYDTDKDGMPDVWETAHGLNPNSATGSNGNNGTVMNDGYTNLEAYINEVGAFPAPSTLVFNNANGTGRFAEIGNWGNIWKPSRFDMAQVNAGTVAVDVVGQHARNLTIANSSGNTATLAVTGGWIDVAEKLAIGPGGTGAVNQSSGIVRAGASVTIGGANNAGTYNLSGGTLATALLTKGAMGGNFNFTGGTLHADQVNFSLTNSGGILAPGSDVALQNIAAASMPDINDQVETVLSFVGNTRVAGNLTMQTGKLQIDLASLTSFDTITVDNLLSLGGMLEVVLDNGYEPTAGSSWKIGTAAGITGNFMSTSSGFTTQVSGGNLFLQFATVPEPSTLVLAALGIAGFLATHRLRQKSSRDSTMTKV
ncbi:MAG TPA: PEP-CTERM sorting domain-containing protein, partial [Pirellulales bacterium]